MFCSVRVVFELVVVGCCLSLCSVKLVFESSVARKECLVSFCLSAPTSDIVVIDRDPHKKLAGNCIFSFGIASQFQAISCGCKFSVTNVLYSSCTHSFA